MSLEPVPQLEPDDDPSRQGEDSPHEPETPFEPRRVEELGDEDAPEVDEEEASPNGAGPDDGPTGRPRFLRGDHFLRADYAKVETLLGEDADQLVPRASFVLIAGDGGDGKSTFAIDWVAHGAAGRNWLGITVSRPLRFCLIENEGAAELFQRKLSDKVKQWQAEPTWIENVFVYADPWGTFTLADPAARVELREFCLEHAIDFVVANPLFGVGGPGAGKPEETSAFVEWLKEVGLWRDVGFGLLHHLNKASEVSGDWNRHADTLIRLERDGDQLRTKLRWVKTRWATTPSETRPAKQLLGWIPEHKGYEVLDVDVGNQVSDDELAGRLNAYLSSNPRSSMNAIYKAVTGDNTRLKGLLEAGEKAGTHHFAEGARGAKLWSLGPGAETTSLFVAGSDVRDGGFKPA